MSGRWYKYELRASALHIGDVFKGGIYKPTVDYLRATAITFCLRRKFGDDEIFAFGREIEGVRKIMIRNPIDRATSAGRISGDRGPIQIEYIENARCEVYVNKDVGDLVEVLLGGFKSLGFGVSVLKKVDEVEDDKVIGGYLVTAIPEEWSDAFGIRRVESPIYGYLFMPDKEDRLRGKYVKSLFPGSYIRGIKILLK